MDKIAVLIPCYNESRTVGKVVRDFKAALPEAVIYVYDNNSTDGTAGLAAEAGAVVRHEHKQGKGNVVRRMFMEVDAECYLMVDGDDTYPAKDAPRMVRRVLEEQADMVVGDRLSSTYTKENKRPFHSFGNILVRSLINLLFHGDIRDAMTGCRAFSYRFVKTCPVLSSGFTVETEMSIHAVDRNMHVVNEVITYRDRPDGSESKLHTCRDGMKVLFTIAESFCLYRPVPCFGLPALMLFLAALCAVFKAHAAVAGGFLMLAGMQFLLAEILLLILHRKDCRDFERVLQRAMEEQKRKQMDTEQEESCLWIP